MFFPLKQFLLFWNSFVDNLWHLFPLEEKVVLNVQTYFTWLHFTFIVLNRYCFNTNWRLMVTLPFFQENVLTLYLKSHAGNSLESCNISQKKFLLYGYPWLMILDFTIVNWGCMNGTNMGDDKCYSSKHIKESKTTLLLISFRGLVRRSNQPQYSLKPNHFRC